MAQTNNYEYQVEYICKVLKISTDNFNITFSNTNVYNSPTDDNDVDEDYDYVEVVNPWMN